MPKGNNLREALDQSELMLDCPTLSFCALLSPAMMLQLDNVEFLFFETYLSICSGEAPCFRVIY